MKKLVNLISVVILIACSITLFSCNPKEELTEGEKSFVGTWILSDDITYVDFGETWGQGTTRYHYPSSVSDSFNSFCEKYIGKVSLVLDGTKNNGKMSGVLSMDGEEKEFTWYVDRSGDAIKFSPSLPIPNYLSSAYGWASVALMDNKRIFVYSDGNHTATMMYFDKCD